MTLEEIKKQEVIDMGVLYSQILCKIEKFENDEQKIAYATEFSDAVEMLILKRDLRRSEHNFNEQQFNLLNKKSS
tara:strand:- start:314 stop:538 length:225 start_codon:yes stop_codon:yes gene_type:complete